MRRIVAVALVGGLIGGLAFAPASAKKKKPKPKLVAVDANYFLRRAECGGEADNVSLSVDDGPDFNGCGSAYSGLPNEALMGSGNGPSAYLWPAVDGIPLTLKTAKDITGEITIGSFAAPPVPAYPAAGQATLVVTLAGMTNGEEQVIGSTSSTYMISPAQRYYTTEFTMTPDKALEKAVFTELQLETYIRGATALHGFYELDNPPAFLTVPTWVKKKK